MVQIESTCRRQNKPDSKVEVCYGMSRKYCGKRRKCWMPAFSPFPTLSSKGVFLNPLPNDNFLDWTKLKALADDKLNTGKI